MNAGTAHGLYAGAQFSVYLDDNVILSLNPLATLVIDDILDFTSTMDISPGSSAFEVAGTSVIALQTKVGDMNDLALHVDRKFIPVFELISAEMFTAGPNSANIAIVEKDKAKLELVMKGGLLHFNILDKHITALYNGIMCIAFPVGPEPSAVRPSIGEQSGLPLVVLGLIILPVPYYVMLGGGKPSVDSPLTKNGGTLTIGYGCTGSSPRAYRLNDGQDVDIGFLKMFSLLSMLTSRTYHRTPHFLREEGMLGRVNTNKMPGGLFLSLSFRGEKMMECADACALLQCRRMVEAVGSRKRFECVLGAHREAIKTDSDRQRIFGNNCVVLC